MEKHTKIICPLCKSRDVKLLTSVRDVEYFTSDLFYNYFNCKFCKSIFLNKPPVNQLHRIYPSAYYSFESNDRSFFHQFLEYSKSYLDKLNFKKSLRKIDAKKIYTLDIGGGTGYMSNVLKDSDRRVFETTILDIDSKAKSTANKNGHKFLTSTIENLNIKNKFNYVLMLNLIEHVYDPLKVLKIVKKSMKRSGLLLIKTPNTLSLNRKIFSKVYWGGYHAPRHWIIFNKQSFSNLAKKSGFIVEDFSYTQGAPQWAASILGTVNIIFSIKSKKPMHLRFSFILLLFFFAVFDFATSFLIKTDQMYFLLRKK